MRILFWAAFTLLLSACAAKPSVSEFQCKAGDWQTIGFRDGAAGAPSSRLLVHQDACGEFNIIPVREDYLAGWHEGLLNFCTAANGFDLGQRGASHNRVCSGELNQPFAGAYADGRQLYLARAQVDELQRRLHERHERLRWVKHEMTDAAAAQLNLELTPEERVHLLTRLHELAQEQGEIRSQIPSLESQLAAREMELERVQQLLAEVSYE